jgi:hypothetical protein
MNTGGLGQAAQSEMFEEERARSLLDQLLIDSQLYNNSKGYKDLLDLLFGCVTSRRSTQCFCKCRNLD